ncbi:MAG: UDP-N-acetylmuramoyl-L-alanine--D-glutamate ligase, partial [Oscillospiraceae bacterium]|nr:UDP-N-acetylmuramoyl-L-alanine--D-glutamate ligase [Oscillospiraceae bacterium]
MLLSEYLDSVKNKRIAVIGIGVSNTGLIELLLKNGCSVLCCDKKERSAMEDTAARLEAMGAKLSLGADYLKNIEADIIFKTPGIRPDIPDFEAARNAGALITSEMEEFCEVCPCRIIAVTGSDGKTTTTTIISELLKAAGKTVHTGGNIGKPLFVEAGDMRPEDYAVLELSSFQLMTMKKSADIAVVTNVTPNHLDYHTGMEEYTQAKKNVFLHQGPEGLLVVNADNDVTAAFEAEAPGRCRAFSRRRRVENGFFADNESVFRAQDGKAEKLLDFGEIKLP